MKLRTLTAALLIALASTVLAEPPPETSPELPPLPDGVAATVHGQALTYDELMLETVRRLGAAQETVLQRLLISLAIQAEAARRGVTVRESEVDDYLKDVERKAGGPEAMDRALATEGRTRAILREYLRLSLLGQKMAATDLKTVGEVDNAQFGIWRTDLLKRLGMETDPAKLPPGVAGSVAGQEVTAIEFGEAIAREIGDGILGEKVYEPWIAVLAIERELAQADVSVTDEEVDADLLRRKTEFESTKQAKSLGLTFEQMLEAQGGRTFEDLRQDREYRGVLGLRKLLASRLTEDDLRAWFAEHEAAFGETRNVQLIQLGYGRDNRFGSGGRTESEARRLATDLVAKLRAGEAWEKVATHSDGKRREAVPVTAASTGPPELMEAIQEAEPGAIVGPIRTLNAFNIFRVTGVLPARTFEEVRDTVEKAVLKKQERAFLVRLRTDPGVVRAKRFR